MKQSIIDIITRIEMHNIGHRPCNSILFNSKEYYRPFEELYLSDGSLFVDSLINLRSGEYKLFDTAQLSYYSNERFLVHLLRVSVYFGVECDSLKSELNNVFQSAISDMNSDCYVTAECGRRLFQAVADFLKVVTNDETNGEIQLFYDDVKVSLPSFKGFILQEDVNDIPSALLYQFCAELGLVQKVPKYINNALKAALIIDSLYGSILWEYYFQHHTHNRFCKDALLLQKVGFVSIPRMIMEIANSIDSVEPLDKEKRFRLCEKMCKKYAEEIKLSMSGEKNMINKYLNSRGGIE